MDNPARKLHSNALVVLDALRWFAPPILAILVLLLTRFPLKADLSKSTYQCSKNSPAFTLNGLTGNYTANSKGLNVTDTGKVMDDCHLPVFNQAGLDNFKTQAEQKGFKDTQIDSFINGKVQEQLAKVSKNPPYKINFNYKNAIQDWIGPVVFAILTLVLGFIGLTIIKNLASNHIKKKHNTPENLLQV